MYNNYIKLTEKHTRDKTRTVYVNLNLVSMIVAVDGFTRLFIGERMVDVTETVEQVLSIEQLLITDKENDTDGRDRNEDGRVSNPA